MYHSLQIIPDGLDIYKANKKDYNGINTWDDWHLIPSSRPLVSVPSVKTNYIDVPGANGSIDATALLGGTPTYNNREGSIEFYVMNGYGEWYDRYTEAMEFLHGQQVKMLLEDDPIFYYEGRMSVNQWKSDKDWSKITLDYHFDPFKYELFSSVEPWLWDPFSFVDGIIRPRYIDHYSGDTVLGPLSGITLSGNNNRINIPIIAHSMPIVPVITAKTNSTPGSGNFLQMAKYKGVTKIAERYVTPSDTDNHQYNFYDLKFQKEDDAVLILVAAPGTSYTVSVSYRGGRF